jgi:drug/metabolite transporter (DMT)-like permease
MIWLALAVIVSALGQVQYKRYSLSPNRLALVMTVLLFLMAPGFSYLALKGLGVDVVYMATSLNTFFVLVLSRMVLKERVEIGQYTSSLVIIIGVVVYML